MNVVIVCKQHIQRAIKEIFLHIFNRFPMIIDYRKKLHVMFVVNRQIIDYIIRYHKQKVQSIQWRLFKCYKI